MEVKAFFESILGFEVEGARALAPGGAAQAAVCRLKSAAGVELPS